MNERTENHICAHCGAKLLRVEVSDTNWAGLECDNPECVTVENRRLRAAIRWALGETDFPARPAGEGAFWWRTELRERSGLDWESSPNNPKNQPASQL